MTTPNTGGNRFIAYGKAKCYSHSGRQFGSFLENYIYTLKIYVWTETGS